MKSAIKEVFSGLKSLAIGMRITIGQFFKPTITVHYPHETLKIPKRFRGHIELVRDPNTGNAICYACKLCERACPSDCITVEGVKLEGAKKKSVSHYVLDFTKCSLCGSCVEACRDSAIQFSREYNLAGVNREDFVMDLFKKLQDQARVAGEQPVATGPRAPGPSAEKPEPLPAGTPSTPGAGVAPGNVVPPPPAGGKASLVGPAPSPAPASLKPELVKQEAA